MRLSPLRHTLFSLGLLGCFAVLSAGCGGGDTYGTLQTVEGKVLADGKPVPTGAVRFVPDTTKGNTLKTEPVGQIDKDGKYAMTTGGKAGAPAGWYKVGVTAQDLPDSSKPMSGKSHVANYYANPDMSGLTIEVVASPAPGAYDLKLKSR